MKHLIYKSCKELAADMYAIGKQKDWVDAVLYYETAVEVAKELLQYEDTVIGQFNVEPPDYDGYVAEFYVSVTHFDEESDKISVSIEPAFHKAHIRNGQLKPDAYYGTDAPVIFVDSDANSEIMEVLDSEDIRMCEFAQGQDNRPFKSVYETVSNDDEIDISNIFNVLAKQIKNQASADEHLNSKVINIIKQLDSLLEIL